MVKFTESRKSFTHFLTQLCAILGGVITVSGLVDRIGQRDRHCTEHRDRSAPDECSPASHGSLFALLSTSLLDLPSHAEEAGSRQAHLRRPAADVGEKCSNSPKFTQVYEINFECILFAIDPAAACCRPIDSSSLRMPYS
jgi:hypothetical protein